MFRLIISKNGVATVNSPPEIITFSGNHFFLKEHVEEICQVITNHMKGVEQDNA